MLIIYLKGKTQLLLFLYLVVAPTMTYRELKQVYEDKQKNWKMKIRLKPKKSQRFWGWVGYLVAFPFVWLFYNIRDWRTAICVIVSFLLWSGSVWVFYLLAAICGWTTDAAKWFIGIGSAVWVWWVSPVGSPFILLVTFTAIGMKMLFDKIKSIRYRKRKIMDRVENPDYNPEYIPTERKDNEF